MSKALSPRPDSSITMGIIEIKQVLTGYRKVKAILFLNQCQLFTAFILTRTRFGLRLRAVGEKPEALDSAGVSVAKTRYLALIVAGVLCGMAGAYLSTAHGSGFVREMTAGKGYIALAAMIFGKWQPRGALLACLLFGFLEAVASRLQGVDVPLIGEAPVDLILALPYLLTVILLAGFVGKAMPPRAIGEPYVKER